MGRGPPVPFEMWSASGWSTTKLVLHDGPRADPLLRVVCSNRLFGTKNEEPTEHIMELPPVEVSVERLQVAAACFERFGEQLGSCDRPPDLTLELRNAAGIEFALLADDRDLIVSDWQAVFRIAYRMGPRFSFQSKYVVDNTCLDAFVDGLNAALLRVIEPSP